MENHKEALSRTFHSSYMEGEVPSAGMPVIMHSKTLYKTDPEERVTPYLQADR